MNWSPVTARMLRLLSLVGQGLLQAIAPNACVFCGVRCGDEQPPICSACRADLPWIAFACERCANPVAVALPKGVHCADCQANPPPYETAAAALSYTFPVDAAIKALKFHRRLHYVPAFAHTLAISMQRLPGDIDALLPVPLHWRRQAMRGFNQAAELGKQLQRETGVPLINNVVRRRATPFQSGLVAKHRRRNLQSAFSVRGKFGAKHVLIVDDVITTGATAGALASVLLDNGAERVSVVAVARASLD